MYETDTRLTHTRVDSRLDSIQVTPGAMRLERPGVGGSVRILTGLRPEGVGKRFWIVSFPRRNLGSQWVTADPGRPARSRGRTSGNTSAAATAITQPMAKASPRRP